ncbi:helix-turn-helix transcriptional regulator [Pseudomonas sp. CDFA 602]|uniref:LexA family transcriptional regulator n=1 Tax=Pseudomonas californiensis TaxID=2829823 RepID=UPI001E55DC80|nr:S24 family peptidase [Pseudomonas californiensis]MCD5994181.1 helix-turn-helix transcriptional regulator [Pseudomonas californiensis]MCD5999720.1 helix-turn-helix transcriptional regulator [Pseudomonas californiensis]
MKKDSRKLPLTDEQIRESDLLKAIYTRKKPELGFTQDKIAADLGEGVSQGAVSHFMNRRTALNIKAASVFAKHLKVPIEEFSTRLANELKNLTDTPALSDDEPDSERDDNFAFIPQYTAKAAAGLGHENPHVESVNTLAFKRDWLRAKGLNSKHLIAISADGDSMWPTINHHDVLLLDTSKTEPADGQVFVLTSSDRGAIVKRLIKTALGGWIIRSDNDDCDDYADVMLARSEVNEHRIIGKVIWRGGDL